MIRQFKADFKYCIYSKLLFGMILLFLLTTVLTFYISYKKVSLEAFAFQNQVEIYQKSGDDIDAALQEKYEILEEASKNEGPLISNPISYHYELLNEAIYSMSSKYTFSLLCEGGLIFFPIICSFFGLIWAASDLKYKTVRNRSLRFGKQSAFYSKQISGFLILIFLFMLIIFASFAIQAFFRNRFLTQNNIDLTLFSYTPRISISFPKQFLFMIWIILFYYEFGFTFGNIMKGNPIAIVIVCVYILLVPPFFKYDIANVCNNFANKLFAFIGAYTLNQLKEASLIIGGFELISILFLLILCNAIIAKKRSAYI